MELEERARSLANWVASVMEQQGDFELAAFGFKGEECTAVFSQGVANSEEAKQAFCERLRDKFKEWGVDTCLVASEAWAAKTEAPLKPEGSLEHYPGRIEVLAIFGHNLAGESLILSREIKRDEEGNFKSLGEEVLNWGGSGRFVEILRPSTPPGAWGTN